MGLGEGSWDKGILEKSLLGQEGKELLRKMKTSLHRNIHYLSYFQSVSKTNFLDF